LTETSRRSRFTRYLVVATLGGAACAGLSALPIDEGLGQRLVAERAARALLANDESRGLIDRATILLGPPDCLRGLRQALGDADGRPPRGGGQSSRIVCEIDGRALVLHLAAGLDDDVDSGEQGRIEAQLPSWTSLLPPLLAVLLALATRRLILSLALAVWAGAVLRSGLDPSLGIVPMVVEVIYPTLADQFRLSIVLFTTTLIGMVNVTTRAGGSQGIALAIARLARGRRAARLATSLFGMAVFFDDYSNCIVVGTTMRPLFDKLRISREKLAYIVDSTAAPIAGVAILSTWIGYEVSLFDDASAQLSLGLGGYEMFLQVLPLRFYCFFTLGFVLISSFTGRDFGPMLRAERQARTGGPEGARSTSVQRGMEGLLERVVAMPGVRPKWQVSLVPVAVVILVTLTGLIATGSAADEVRVWAEGSSSEGSHLEYLRRCLGAANVPFVLLLGALAGTAVAFGFALTRRDESGTGHSSRTSVLAIASALALVIAAGLTALAIGGHWDDLIALARGGADALPARSPVPVVMVLATVLGLVLALSLTVRRAAERRGACYPISLGGALVSFGSGARAMAVAVGILVLAWSLQTACQALGTSVFIVAALADVFVVEVLPLIVFLAAAAVAFATGTSWGAMGILLPAILPLAHHMGGAPLVLLSAGAVLDGAIFGDHCSPISDTTVISSISSGCDHLAHVRTQLPYALMCMGVAATCYVAVMLGLPLWGTLILGFLLVGAGVVALGRPIDR